MELYFEIWSEYWGGADYADVSTTAACQGAGDLDGTSSEMRSESSATAVSRGFLFMELPIVLFGTWRR